MSTPKPPIPITILTGFVGSGKTTLLLNMLPQLRTISPTYKLSLIKNEIGDLAIDSALAASSSLSSSRELLGSCICCTNVGQLGSSLEELLQDEPDRIVVETSGSAEPVKLVVEVNRLAKETGLYALDGVVAVVDVVNWEGYSSTSYTAKLQARQTDLIVLNKWEDAGEEKLERVLDRLGDMDVETPHVKSEKGWVDVRLLFGLDGKMVKGLWEAGQNGHDHQHGHDGDGGHSHMEELECLDVTLDGEGEVDLQKLDDLLKKAPRDEVYRIKALLRTSKPPIGLDEGHSTAVTSTYILNWSFGRHTWTRVNAPTSPGPLLRLSMFLAQYESTKWTKRLQSGHFVALLGAEVGAGLQVKKVL